MCYNMDKPGHYTKLNKPATIRYILYESTYMKYLEYSQSHRDRKQNGGVLGLREEENGELYLTVYRVSVLQDENSFGNRC